MAEELNDYEAINAKIDAIENAVSSGSVTNRLVALILRFLNDECDRLSGEISGTDENVGDLQDAAEDLRLKVTQLTKDAATALALASNINDDLYGTEQGTGQLGAEIDGAVAGVAELRTRVGVVDSLPAKIVGNVTVSHGATAVDINGWGSTKDEGGYSQSKLVATARLNGATDKTAGLMTPAMVKAFAALEANLAALTKRVDKAEINIKNNHDAIDEVFARCEVLENVMKEAGI